MRCPAMIYYRRDLSYPHEHVKTINHPETFLINKNLTVYRAKARARAIGHSQPPPPYEMYARERVVADCRKCHTFSLPSRHTVRTTFRDSVDGLKCITIVVHADFLHRIKYDRYV